MEPVASAAGTEASLWRRLRAGGDAVAREQLLEMHLPYARIVAATYYAKRHSNEVEFEDFLQYASVGMIEAMDRYDPDRGVQFRTFAARRMHGSILNGIERLTERQQQIAARQRLRRERLQDVAELAGLDARDRVPDQPEQLLRMVRDLGIGLAICWMLEGTGMVESADSCVLPFYRTVALRQLRERLLHAVDTLPPQEKLVVRSHYLQDLPFDAVAESMHLTKGRISQIHKQALLRLRALVCEDSDWSADL